METSSWQLDEESGLEKELRKSSAHDDGPETPAAGQTQQGRPVGIEGAAAQALSTGNLGHPEAAEKGNRQWRQEGQPAGWKGPQGAKLVLECEESPLLWGIGVISCQVLLLVKGRPPSVRTLAGSGDKITETWTREVWQAGVGVCKSLIGVGLRRGGSNPSFHPQEWRDTTLGLSIQWNIMQPHKGNCDTLQHG